jgi:hypothetical protein
LSCIAVSARARARTRIAAFVAFLAIGIAAAGCGAIPFNARPAANYTFGSDAPLKVAVIDETGGNDWSPALRASLAMYSRATPYLDFRTSTAGAHIIIHVRRYDDAHPPELSGYVFPFGAGGFATVYDTDGIACNYPPSSLPVNCSGEIAEANIYLNDIIPPGSDVEARRQRLILHELGHSLGLTRHSPDLDIGQLAQRYGWN